ELFDAAWADTIVPDDTLTRCIGELRKIFGDDARNPRVIETIPRVGYRLIRQPTTRDEGASPSEVSPREATAPSPPRPSTRKPSTFTAQPLWIGAVALVGLIAWQFLRPEGDGNEPPSPLPPGAAPLAPAPLPSYPGRESMVAFSPGGGRFAFVWTQEQPDLVVRALVSSEPLRLTDDPARKRSPVWSPDGASIAFVRTSGGECGIFIMPALGGPEREVTSCTGYS